MARLIGLILVLGVACGAAAAPSTLPAGESVIKGPAGFELIGDRAGAELQKVAVAGEPFDAAMRIDVKRLTQARWSLQLHAVNTAAVRKGDVLLSTFWARCVAGPSDEGRTAFVFEIGQSPYTKSVEYTVTLTRQWQRFDVPFKASQDFAPGAANINFQLGFPPQTIEIAAVSVLNFGSKVKIGDLPRTRLTYRGQPADAAWRKDAAERIDRFRKGELTIIVTDADEKPLAGADVRVTMTRHAFAFGSAVAAKALLAEGPDGERYREFVAAHCTRVVFENDLKWPQWEDKLGRARMLQACDWLHERGIDVRGHCLVWPSWRYMPKDVETLKDKPDSLRKRVADHVRDEAAAMRGKLVEWDVINEPYTNHDVMDVLGSDAMVDWFRLAREADPQARLFLNDYAILAAGGIDHAHQDHFEKTLRMLRDKGAPLGGIGMQGHFDSDLTPPERLIEILDRFAKLDLPIEVTEFDVGIDDTETQADYTRDFLTAVFSHPRVEGILTWGFWEGRHWRPDAAMYANDWTLRPNGRAWLDLVKKQWWTSETGKTGPDGTFTIRGFLGEYVITAVRGKETLSAKVRMGTTDGARVTMK
jgi:GH35 family endo-1,4-beta-xylanase